METKDGEDGAAPGRTPSRDSHGDGRYRVIQTIHVDWLGQSVPVNHLASIKMQEDRILCVPFDRTSVPAVVKALWSTSG